ncbi:MAG: hypothetical protein WC285_01375 [Candidatus Gracilibacteria bacterium]|jgi:Tfp pilus assembly protein PilO
MLTQNATSTPEIGIKGTSRTSSFVGVFMIILAVLAFALFVKPLATSVGNLKADVASKTVELDSLKTQVADMEKAENMLGSTSELQRLEMIRSIPVGLKQDEAIKDIVQLSKDYNIELTSIGFGKGMTDRAKIGALQVNASFDGTYEDLTEFLRALEQNARMFRVNSISVQLMNTDVVGLKRAVFALAMDTFYQE